MHLLPRRASLLHTLALTFAQIRHPMWQTENAIPNPSVRLRVVAGMRPGAAMTLLWLETAGSSRLGLQRAALSSKAKSRKSSLGGGVLVRLRTYLLVV